MNEFEVTCNDGTKDVSNGAVQPCLANGGVKAPPAEDKHIIKGLSTGERWAWFIGVTAVAYFLLYKSGALKKNV